MRSVDSETIFSLSLCWQVPLLFRVPTTNLRASNIYIPDRGGKLRIKIKIYVPI